MAKSPTKTADDPHPPQVFREAGNAARYNARHRTILPVAGKSTAAAGYLDTFFEDSDCRDHGFTAWRGDT
mgnify:CR=1 FL=1|jgi:hypothetical protein